MHAINENGPIPEAVNTPSIAAKLQAAGARQPATSAMSVVTQVALQAFHTVFDLLDCNRSHSSKLCRS